MTTILSLLKLQIDNKSDILKTASPKTMIPAILKAAVIIALATLAVSFGLSKVFVLGFIINRELLSLLLLLTQLISLAFAVGNIINTLYLSKDNEMLFCLPVTANQLFVSKLLMIYINELYVNAMISIPLFFTLGTFSSFGASYYLSLVILLLLLPILPIVAAAFLSIPIMAVVRFLKRHTVLSIFVIFSLVAACLWVYISIIGNIASEFNIANKQYETVRGINTLIMSIGSKIVIYYQIAATMVSFQSWYYFPLFILVCALVSVFTIFFTRRLFFKTAMSNLENTIKKPLKNKEHRSFKKRNALLSLFIKEVLCVFRSPADVFEYFLFTILMPFIVFSYDKLLMSITVNQAGINMIAGAHVMVVAILAMLSNISSASAISRDGGNFYTSKIIPVNYYTQMFGKFLFNAVFTLSALLVTALVSVFIYPVWQVALGTLAIAMASVGHIAYCIDSDIKNPTVNNGGDEKSSTVSKTTPKSLIYGLVIGFVMGLTVILMSSLEYNIVPYIILILSSFIFMIYRIYTLVLRINLNYDKIEM